MARLLLLLPTTTYRTEAFMAAAARCAVDVVVATETPSTLESKRSDRLLTLDFKDAAAAAQAAARFAAVHPIDAVVAVDEDTALVASTIGERLGLPHNTPASTRCARDKLLFRVALAAAGVACPLFKAVAIDADPRVVGAAFGYPVVLKPRMLSASRGVIRADDEPTFVAAWRRVVAILAEPDVTARDPEAARTVLIERFIPGIEVGVEAILLDGRLEILAIFDKPDPLDGPFFEETIYVTPSRLDEGALRIVERAVRDAAAAMGLRTGPLHAEVRFDGVTAWPVEVAARSIGGLCSRALRFGTGLALEDLIVHAALGRPIASLERENCAAGVMMIPVPGAGRLEGVIGVEEALALPHVEDVKITAHPGMALVPLPEGASYLGFIFARADTPAEVEDALRAAHRTLTFQLGPPTDDPAG